MPFTKDGREFEIKFVLTVVCKVDVEKFKGNREELAATIDKYYSNQIWFDPKTKLRTSMIKYWGNDFAENARSIYFADDLRGIDKLHLLDDPCDFDLYHPKVISERRIFIPSFKGIDWQSAEEAKRRARARTASSHALQKEEWNKSEFA